MIYKYFNIYARELVLLIKHIIIDLANAKKFKTRDKAYILSFNKWHSIYWQKQRYRILLVKHFLRDFK